MKKFFLIPVLILVCFFSLFANGNEIDKFIKQTDIENKAIISILVKDINSGKILYKKNEKKSLNPASTLKVFSYGAAEMVLGKDYNFETSIYRDSNNNIYIELGADPLFTKNNLKELIKQANIKQIGNIYIDDTIIDKTPYPISWMQDDIWPYQRMTTPYIIDNNINDIFIKRSSLSTRVDIIQNSDYKMAIVNKIRPAKSESDVKKIEITKLNGEDSPIICLNGIIAQDEIIKLPVLDPEINFKVKILSVLDDLNIIYNKKITAKKIPLGAKKIASFKTPIDKVSKEILYNSDNFTAEVVFKVAAAKYINYSHPATLDDALNMFYKLYNIDENEIKIADGSGVSRYSLLDSNFIVDKLIELNSKTDIKSKLPTPGNGTLKDRMPMLANNLRAKTGTHLHLSSICGYLTTKNNDNIAFSVAISNSPKRKGILKNFEDRLIMEIYRKM